MAWKRLRFGHLLPADTKIAMQSSTNLHHLRLMHVPRGGSLLPESFIFLMTTYGPQYAPVTHITSYHLSS